jgi:hypothetical protein
VGGYRSEGIADALLREFILRIKVERGSEIGECFNLTAAEQFRIAAVEMHAGETFAAQLTRGNVFDILRYELGCLLELNVGLIEFL